MSQLRQTDKTIYALTDEDLDNLARKTARATIVEMNDEIIKMLGRSVRDKLIYVFGTSALAIYIYLTRR